MYKIRSTTDGEHLNQTVDLPTDIKPGDVIHLDDDFPFAVVSVKTKGVNTTLFSSNYMVILKRIKE